MVGEGNPKSSYCIALAFRVWDLYLMLHCKAPIYLVNLDLFASKMVDIEGEKVMNHNRYFTSHA